MRAPPNAWQTPPVPHPFARQAPADPALRHQVDGPLFEHARAHALDDVRLAAILDDDRIDTAEVQQVAEHQPGRTGADDADLGAGAQRAATSDP